MKRRLALLAPFALLVWAPVAHADTLQSFSAAGRASGFEVTQDGANANFHPQGELVWDFASATLGSGAHALSTFAWPGGAGGNAGSLVALLGGPDVSALNDPARAEVDSGGAQQSTVTAPSGSTMTASVQPEQEGDRESRATTTSADAGSGAVGASSATSKVLLHNGTLTASAQSSASGIDLAGVVHIDSVLSTASATSNGGAPTDTGSTIVHGMTIAGQQAYVDANGVHTGAPGKPSDPVAVQQVNTALSAAGLQIYFTAAHDIVVGQVSYYYAASILFFWAPPGDTGKDSFTLSLGGAAVAMNVTGGPGALDSFTIADDSGTGATSFDTASGTTAAPVLELPTASAPAIATPARPSAPAAAIQAQPAAATLPRGLGGWVLVAGLAALGGAVLLARVPALLASAAAAGCPREQHPEGADR